VDRVAQNRSGRASIVFTDLDGMPTSDVSYVSVDIYRRDGSNLIEGAEATAGDDTGRWSVTLTPDETDLLDVLELRWTATVEDTEQTFTTHAEVCGGFLFDVARLRDDRGLEDAGKHPAQALIEARTLAEDALEEACGVAFVPRYTLDTVDGPAYVGPQVPWPGTYRLLLPRTRVRAVRFASVRGVEITDLSTLTVATGGVLVRSTPWTSGAGSVIVGYEHGYDSAPPRVSRACLILARTWLQTGLTSDRALSVATQDGLQALATAGVRGATFGIPEVDAVVEQYSERVLVG
jgi:hypothetical protein